MTGGLLKVKITQLKLKVPYDELMERFKKDAPLFNEVGITWKIWMENKEEGLLGSIMLFKDLEAFDNYPNHPIQKNAPRHMFEVVSSQAFDVIEDISLVNNAPI